jgi:hypothetical protein
MWLLLSCRPYPTLAGNNAGAVDPPLALRRDRRCAGALGKREARGAGECECGWSTPPGPQVWKPGPWRRATRSAGSSGWDLSVGNTGEYRQAGTTRYSHRPSYSSAAARRLGRWNRPPNRAARGGDVELDAKISLYLSHDRSAHPASRATAIRGEQPTTPRRSGIAFTMHSGLSSRVQQCRHRRSVTRLYRRRSHQHRIHQSSTLKASPVFP